MSFLHTSRPSPAGKPFVSFMGATLPVLSRFFVRSLDQVGYPVGVLYSVNTFGAVLGWAAAGFFLISKFSLTPEDSIRSRSRCARSDFLAVNRVS